jgi:hypothetical protein
MCDSNKLDDLSNYCLDCGRFDDMMFGEVCEDCREVAEADCGWCEDESEDSDE